MNLNLKQLATRCRKSWKLLEHCRLCPRKCGINRIEGEVGFCGIRKEALIYSHGPHFGEEFPLVGKKGSGVIFFCGCNLGCVFCQNHGISRIDIHRETEAEAVDADGLAGIMLDLQTKECANINLVTPSHLIPQILAGLLIAFEHGLDIPIVYNSGGYDSVESLSLLDGIVDIYMPDCKFISTDYSRQYLGAVDYPKVMYRAVTEMHRQVGDLVIDKKNGLAKSGLLVRHLIMPGLFEDSRGIIQFIAEKISKDTFINIMDQYHPCYRAKEYPEINRTLFSNEYNQVVKAAREAGLHRFNEIDTQKIMAMITGRNQEIVHRER